MDKGVKHDSEKLRYDLLPLKSLEDIVGVLSYGANKYSDNNWQHVSPFNDRYYAAILRHVVAWRRGEIKDPESGYPHLAHALCCLIFLNEGPAKEKEVEKCVMCENRFDVYQRVIHDGKSYCIKCMTSLMTDAGVFG